MTRKKENPISRETDGDSLAKLYKINDEASLAGLSDGVQAGYAFSPEEWLATAKVLTNALAASGAPFTVDDLRRAGAKDPDKSQRWGSLFAALQNQGTIRLVGILLHRTPGGASIGIRQWQGNPEKRSGSAASKAGGGE